MATYLQQIKFGVTLITFCWLSNALAADLAGNTIRVKGNVIAKAEATRELGPGDSIMEGETIITGPSSGAQLQMKDGAIIALSADTELTISSYNFNEPDGQQDKVWLLLKKGSIRTITGDTAKENYVLETPSSLVRIQGTVYDMQVNPEGKRSTIILREGAVLVESTCNSTGTGDQQLIDVPGMATIIAPCEPPQEPVAASDEIISTFAALDDILIIDTEAGGGEGTNPPAPPTAPPPASP